MKAAIYARVSTTDQNCDHQLKELREYCSRRGWEVYGEYTDTGWSGLKASRPQFDRIMKDARLVKFDCIVVWMLDRWGRSIRHCLQTLEELRNLGVRFIAIMQNIDTSESNPTSVLLLHLLAVFAQFEAELTRERVRASIRLAKERGVQLGRRKLVFDREVVHRLRKEGMSIRKISKQLGISHGTVQRCINENG